MITHSALRAAKKLLKYWESMNSFILIIFSPSKWKVIMYSLLYFFPDFVSPSDLICN
jgi:hypothetical protein